MQKNFIKNYDAIARWFAKSRKNMKWDEIDYFVEKYFPERQNEISVLDVWCGSWRLYEQFCSMDFLDERIWHIDYFWVDLSPAMIEEAGKNFISDMFMVLDMENIDELEGNNFDFVFFIASFHHKKFLRERLKTMKNLEKILKPWSLVFLTNWALTSEVNKEKFKNSEISFIENDFENIADFEEKQKEKQFWSKDFSIKFWEFYRYYHSFTLEELEFIFKEANFEIVENRLFDNWRNFISVLRKK